MPRAPRVLTPLEQEQQRNREVAERRKLANACRPSPRKSNSFLVRIAAAQPKVKSQNEGYQPHEAVPHEMEHNEISHYNVCSSIPEADLRAHTLRPATQSLYHNQTEMLQMQPHHPANKRPASRHPVNERPASQPISSMSASLQPHPPATLKPIGAGHHKYPRPATLRHTASAGRVASPQGADPNTALTHASADGVSTSRKRTPSASFSALEDAALLNSESKANGHPGSSKGHEGGLTGAHAEELGPADHGGSAGNGDHVGRCTGRLPGAPVLRRRSSSGISKSVLKKSGRLHVAVHSSSGSVFGTLGDLDGLLTELRAAVGHLASLPNRSDLSSGKDNWHRLQRWLADVCARGGLRRALLAHGSSFGRVFLYKYADCFGCPLKRVPTMLRGRALPMPCTAFDTQDIASFLGDAEKPPTPQSKDDGRFLLRSAPSKRVRAIEPLTRAQMLRMTQPAGPVLLNGTVRHDASAHHKFPTAGAASAGGGASGKHRCDSHFVPVLV